MRKFVSLAIVVGWYALPGFAVADDWITLIKDDHLTGWEAGGGETSFTAKDGTMTIDGTGQIVYWPGGKPLDLKDFELRAEVLTKPGGRAGLTFHLSGDDPRSSGGIEIRLDNTYGIPGPGRQLLKTGSLVWLRPVVKSIVPDDRWFPINASVKSRRVQVKVDGKLVVDYLAPEDTAPVPKLRKGTIAVRGHGGSGPVMIRKLEVRALADVPPVKPASFDPVDADIARQRDQGFSLVDYHVRAHDFPEVSRSGRGAIRGATAWTWRTGIGSGVVVPCGPGLPVADNQMAEAFLQSVDGRPFFVGMKVEDRNWAKLFSPATVARFDYIMADALTLNDSNGRRMRLWVKEEVNISDPESFMELLVKHIETILEKEPIDVFANPTYLPQVIAKDYERLWTVERMKRVVNALAKNGVALEINDRLRLPSPGFIKMAKRAEVKFAFGGAFSPSIPGDESEARPPGRLEYCLQTIRDCALTPEDLWSPKPPGRKPIQVRK